jgi:16S rRNA U1498 N3-methylase RsmE
MRSRPPSNAASCPCRISANLSLFRGSWRNGTPRAGWCFAMKTPRRIAALTGLPRSPLAVLIGPEGGFAEDERTSLLKLPNLVRLSFGPRILRADTAAVAALTLVQAVLGDWRSAAG